MATFNVLFYRDESDLHFYYFVESGKVHFLGDRFLESELPARLQGMRHTGLQSVSIFIHKKLPSGMAEWQQLDQLQKELRAAQVISLEPQDSVESWIARVHQEMEKHDAELAELSITATERA